MTAALTFVGLMIVAVIVLALKPRTQPVPKLDAQDWAWFRRRAWERHQEHMAQRFPSLTD